MERIETATLTSDYTSLSAEEFDAWVRTQSNNARYELISGKVYEVPSNAYASMLAAYISMIIGNCVLKHQMGWITVEGGGYHINGERYAPDIAFMRYERQRRPERVGYNPVAPNIAIEILSSDTPREQEDLRLKIPHYLAADTIVLVINSVTEAVELHVPGKTPVRGDATSKITFGNVIPGFTFDMQAVFNYANDKDDQP